MIKLIRRFTYFIFKKLIPAHQLLKYLENEKVLLNSQNCIKDSGTILYKDSTIINLQNNPSKINIGKNCIIRGELFINEYGGEIIIGDNSYVGEYSRIWSGEKVSIGNRVQISHSVNIIDTNTHSLNPILRSDEYNEIFKTGNLHTKGDIKTASIKIEDDVWISFNVTILKGVVIGKGAVIAANTIVLKNVPPYSVVAGYPAKLIKYIPHYQPPQEHKVSVK